MTAPIANSRAARDLLVEALALDLIGPDNDHPCARELLPESPYKWYLTGYLVPTDAPESQRFDPTSMDDIDQAAGKPGADDDQPVDRSAGGKSFMPSSIGMSVLVGPDARMITLRAFWGDYEWESEEEEHSDAPDLEETEEEIQDGPGGSSLHDPEAEYGGRRTKASTKGYRRHPREEEVRFLLDEIKPGEAVTREVPNGRGLVVSLLIQPLRDSLALGLPVGSRAISAFLVNYRKADENFVYRNCAFQAALDLEADVSLLPQPDLRGLGNTEDHDWDERLADLQYRGIHEYSCGHGVATRSLPGEKECRKARTTWMPSHEVERVAASKIPGVEFRMRALGEMKDPAQFKSALQPLVSAYRAWIQSQKAGLSGLSKERRGVAETALAEASAAADRMEQGIHALCSDAKAFAAFGFANRAMACAAKQRLQLEDPAWRPFQLAFVLLNLPGLIDEASPDREVVDLLFFPTGGGKTEAYLGLAAFTMVLRRLRHEHPRYGGLSVLMRYTLRLLTLDQLGRAAGVVCALELERELNPELGSIPFEIGLWVGSGATPNRMGGKGYKGPGREHTAYHKVNQFRSDTGKPSPIPLESCPWCGSKFGRNSFKLTPNETEPDNLVIRCENRGCDFSGQKRNLPILSVDEPIYRRLPAFLIATVDKFAALPWEGRSGALLGHVDRHDSSGFYGAMDVGAGVAFGGPLPGPELIIQDELHLISGPLGTIAGVYETAIDHLCSREAGGRPVRPKIIASTATVRRADRQIEALFGRHSSKVFPPPGPDLRDTFFARTERIEESNGRLYLGVAAQGRSLKVVLMRAALALLCAGKNLYEEAGGATKGNPVDPYMTLMGYFNSLRELGGSRRIIEDEVVSRAQKYGGRRRRDPKVWYFSSREVDYEPQELTSRVSTAKVAATKRLLDRYFDEDPKGGRPVDVALATNMISVGLDITRLGLMVVLGQPKSSAEYIQATSRVGRNPDAPGLVITLLNVHKPRDRSHYEHFNGFHRTFYRAVEATSVTPFSPRALDRALAAALVAVTRHSDTAFTPPLGASVIMAKRQQLDEVARLFARRAEHHDSGMTSVEASDLHDKLLHRCRDLLDSWLAIQQDRQSAGAIMQYQAELKSGNHPRLLHDFLEENLPAPAVQFRKFRANRSMRDVEPSVELVTKELQEPLQHPTLMAKDSIRSGQLVTTFGPGSMVDLPDSAVIVAGLDHWNYDAGEPPPLVEEPRLLATLRQQLDNPPSHLRKPPPAKDRDKGFTPHVTAWQFPEWFVVQRGESIAGGGKRRRLVPKQLLQAGRFLDDHGKRQPVVPVRFVQSCSKGHVDDIDWLSFVHPDAEAPCTYPMWMEERGTSGTLADTWIVCGCGKERSMSQAARRQLKALGSCKGRRPWLGPASREACGEPGRLLIRSASNAYFPQILSVISIPETGGELQSLVGKLWTKGLSIVGSGVPLGVVRSSIAEVGAALHPYSDIQVVDAIAKFQGGEGRKEKAPKTAEFEAFASTTTESGSDVPDGDFFARVLPETQWKTGKPWMDAFSKIVLVHRLREVVAQVGFTRFEAAVPELNGELDIDVKPQVLSRTADWLPAIENRGEGIFLQFDSAAIAEWMGRKSVVDRATTLAAGFDKKMSASGKKSRPFHGAPFYMVHSFSHLLMTRIALDCGYPSSSIRERIYAEGDDYGLLIYTGSSDAEGTLGGLVQAGRRISDIVRRALCHAELCSNDPVCSAQKPDPDLQRELLGAACHGCLLIAETSCEHRNCFLDRPLVVRTMEGSGSEFFQSYGL